MGKTKGSTSVERIVDGMATASDHVKSRTQKSCKEETRKIKPCLGACGVQAGSEFEYAEAWKQIAARTGAHAMLNDEV